jgi:hypothetical protein
VTTFPYHAETQLSLRVPAEALFAHLDDHMRLSAHMTRRSWMMAGSRMSIETDAGKGRRVGSVIRLHGRVLGIRLELEEVVTEREPPLRKTWETSREPRLLVIGAYRMGFEIQPAASACVLRVHLDYALPRSRFSRALARMVGRRYARWCTERMARDARGLES